MRYSLIRDSRVVIIYEGKVWQLDALSNYDVSTSYQEYKSTRKTIHSKRNYPVSKVVAQDATTISLICNFSTNGFEGLFFELLGMTEEIRDVFYLNYTSPVSPKMFEMYVYNKSGLTFHFENCFLTLVDISLSKEIPTIQLNIESGKFRTLTEHAPIPATLIQGYPRSYGPLYVYSNGLSIPGVISAAISSQQQCSWREQRSIHDIGSIYTNKYAVVNEQNISATIEMHYINSSSLEKVFNEQPLYDVPLLIKTSFVEYYFPSTRIMKRLDLSDVYKTSFDIIPVEGSERVRIRLFGERE